MRRIKGVLFDVDGTLVDSNDAHAQAFVDAFAECGLQVPFARVRPLIGMGSDKLIPTATGLPADHPTAQASADRKKVIFRERHLPTLRPFPKADQLVRDVQGRGLTVGVASSAEPDELRELLTLAGVADLAKTAASTGDADRSKPDPDIVRAAVGKLGLEPRECLLIGDTPYDVEAGVRAGTLMIALRCGGWADEALRDAHQIFTDPADLLNRLDELGLGPVN
jgi:HAD superfamily hydrolase (TIGR01509 family)